MAVFRRRPEAEDEISAEGRRLTLRDGLRLNTATTGETGKGFKDRVPGIAFAFLVLSGLIYTLLHNIYRLDGLEDGWMLCYADNWINHGITGDPCFGSSICGVRYCLVTYSFLYGKFLNLVGWTKPAAFLLSTVLVLAGVVVWYFILKSLRFSKRIALTFVLVIAAIEPFFSAAKCARPEALVFLLISLSMWSFIRDRRFLSGALAMIACETHPAGVFVLAYVASIAAYEWVEVEPGLRPLFRRCWAFIPGCLVGLTYYFVMHYQFLSAGREAMAGYHVFDGEVKNILFAYYFKSKMLRHIPELVLIGVAAWVFISRSIYAKEKFAGIFALVMVVTSFIVPYPNAHYALYFYPAFILLVLVTFERIGRLNLVLALLLALLVPQYSFVYYKNHDWDFNAYLTGVRSAVPKDALPVVGGADVWFALRNREFHALNYNSDFKALGLKRFYLIDNGNLASTCWPDMEETIKNGYTRQSVTSFTANGQRFNVALLKRIPSRGE